MTLLLKEKTGKRFLLDYDPAIHGPMQKCWFYYLSGHALTHGIAVYTTTGDVYLGIVETIAHFIIDFGKCERFYGIHID